MVFCHSTPLFRWPAGNVANSIKTLLPVDPLKLPYPLPWSHHNGQIVSGRGGVLCDITKRPTLLGAQSPGASEDKHTMSHFLCAQNLVPEMVLFLAYVCLQFLYSFVFLSGRWSWRTPRECALRKALSNSAEFTISPKDWLGASLSAFSPHCALHDTEVSRKHWRE